MERQADFKETVPKKESSKTWKIVIYLVVIIVVTVAGAYLYINIYMIPHDAAVENYSNTVEQYNAAVSSLEERNTALDDSIAALANVIYTDT